MNFLEDYGIKPKMTSDTADKPKINLFDFTQKATAPKVVASTKWRWATSYFSDEIKAFNNMLRDWVDETEAKQVITDRRKDLLGSISQKESSVLSKMIEDWLDTTTAINVIKEQRDFEKKQAEKELNILQKTWLWLTRFTGSTLAWWVWQVWWIADFVSWWDSELGKMAMEWRQTQRDIMWDSKLGMAWEILWAWAIDYWIWAWLWKVAWLWAKFNKLSTWKQLVTWWAWFWALTAVWEKWSETTAWDIAMWAWIGAWAWVALWKVVIPAIAWTVQKGMKYWTALQKWWTQWLTKSISRDLTKPLWAFKEWIQWTADNLSTNINRMTKWEIQKFQKEYKVSPWKFLNDRWISESWDELVSKLSKNLTKSRQEADKGIQSIKWNFKAPKQQIATDVIDETTWTYKVIDSDPVETMLKDNLSNASSKGLSKDSLRAKELLEKYKKDWLSMSEINEWKRWFQANNKFSYLTDDTSSRKWFVTWLDNTVREWQFDTAKKMWFDNLKEINKQTKAYYQLLEWITKWNEWSKWNLPMWLTDWLAFNADPSIFLAKQVAESWTLKKGIIKTLNLWRKTQAEVKPALLNKSKTNVNNINSSNNSSTLESSKLKNVKPKVLPTKAKKILKDKNWLPILKQDNIDRINPKTWEWFDKNGKSLWIVDKRPLKKTK